VFEQTGDEARAQGWTPFIVDANGNGKRDEWVEPNQAVDPAKDKRVAVNFYAVAANPKDGSIWGTSLAPFPSYVVRVAPGADPTNTALTEIYEPPFPAILCARRRHRPEWRLLRVAVERHPEA
jgi:hypothetical protein